MQYAMTADERRQWDEQGFLIREGVFTPEECDDLSARAEALATNEDVPAKRRKLNALAKERGEFAMHSVARPQNYDEAFRAHVRDPRVTDVLVDLLGPNLVSHTTLFIFKAPGVGLPFPWHQDMWYFRRRFGIVSSVGTWQAMDDATVENGTLWVIPGSHKEAIVEHDMPEEGPRQEEFRVARVPEEWEKRAVPVEVPKGSVLWFHGHLLHKSAHNHSEKSRRTYVAHYLTAEAEGLTADPAPDPTMWVRGEIFPGRVQPAPDEELTARDKRWAEERKVLHNA